MKVEERINMKTKKPEPPLNVFRLTFDIRISGYCPKCRSHTIRKFLFFGERECINPNCGYID